MATNLAVPPPGAVPDASNDWRCLPEALGEGSVEDPTARAVLSVRLAGFVNESQRSGATVRACTVRDPDCLAPVTDWVTPSADGWVDLPLYQGFDGYLEILADGAVPTMLFYSAPLRASTPPDPEPAFVVDTGTAASFDRLFAGREVLPTTGVLVLRATDCGGDPAAGVHYSLEPPAASWYYVADVPVANQDATGESGVGGYSEVQPGAVLVRAVRVGSDQPLARARSVFVRAGWFTTVRFTP